MNNENKLVINDSTFMTSCGNMTFNFCRTAYLDSLISNETIGLNIIFDIFDDEKNRLGYIDICINDIDIKSIESLDYKKYFHIDLMIIKIKDFLDNEIVDSDCDIFIRKSLENEYILTINTTAIKFARIKGNVRIMFTKIFGNNKLTKEENIAKINKIVDIDLTNMQYIEQLTSSYSNVYFQINNSRRQEGDKKLEF